MQGGKVKLHRGVESLEIETDGIVMAMGAKPNQSLELFLRSFGRPYYLIGDCLEVRGIATAVHEGFRVAMEI